MWRPAGGRSSPLTPAQSACRTVQDAEHYKAYEVSESGRSPGWLGSAEAEARLAQFGPTVLPHARGPGRIARFVSQFNHPLIYVLLGAALVTGMLGETFDAAVILGVVLVNAIVGFIQESRADAALAALAQLTRSNARLIRDGVPARRGLHLCCTR